MAKGGIEPPDTWIFSPLLCGGTELPSRR